RAGVSQMVVTGTSEAVSRRALALAHRYPGILYATAGVHPHDARHWRQATASTLADLAADPAVVAVGETGLDFCRDYSPRPDQQRAFEAQLELAAALALPVFLHERQAFESFRTILSRWRGRLAGAVVHCFTGNGEELAAYRDLDVHIGITGWICDERRGLHLRRLVKEIPPDRLLLETDAPFLLPRDLRPRPKNGRNEPAFLPHILATVADCLDQPVAEVAARTTANARHLFNLPSPIAFEEPTQ
ncbi:MAG: TatD family hydrolase, partial [Candidatus Competibacteraceae bacterium]|nr:TatD family hydrolase [Candidatus Competibacteraceae bacterium]